MLFLSSETTQVRRFRPTTVADHLLAGAALEKAAQPFTAPSLGTSGSLIE